MVLFYRGTVIKKREMLTNASGALVKDMKKEII